MVLLLAYALTSAYRPKSVQLRLYNYEVVKEYPHDPAAFTQGLEFDRNCSSGGSQANCTDVLWESTGKLPEDIGSSRQ